MMKTNEGLHYAFGGQAVVDEGSQVILSAELTQEAADFHQLIPMIATTKENLEAISIQTVPAVVLADAGYCSAETCKRSPKPRPTPLSQADVSSTPSGYPMPHDAASPKMPPCCQRR